MILKEKTIQAFNLKPYGSIGWMNGDLDCPFCGAKGRQGKFAVILNEHGASSYHCFKASCPSPTGSLYNVLKEIGRTDLMGGRREHPLQKKIENKLRKKEEEQHGNEFIMPYGLKEVMEYGSGYLNSRGWTEKNYKQFKVSICKSADYAKYLLFFLTENKKIVGFLGRSVYDKRWHKANEILAIAGEEVFFARYKNSKGVDFKKIVGAIDEAEDEAIIVIVEGIMDYVNVSNIAGDLVSCVFTNGAKLSEEQAEKIAAKKPNMVYVMYDNGAEEQARKAGLLMTNYVGCVMVCELKTERDPGDFNREEFLEAIHGARNVIEVKTGRLINKLKNDY
jgi:hypothetical protein